MYAPKVREGDESGSPPLAGNDATPDNFPANGAYTLVKLQETRSKNGVVKARDGCADIRPEQVSLPQADEGPEFDHGYIKAEIAALREQVVKLQREAGSKEHRGEGPATAATAATGATFAETGDTAEATKATAAATAATVNDPSSVSRQVEQEEDAESDHFFITQCDLSKAAEIAGLREQVVKLQRENGELRQQNRHISESSSTAAAVHNNNERTENESSNLAAQAVSQHHGLFPAEKKPPFPATATVADTTISVETEDVVWSSEEVVGAYDALEQCVGVLESTCGQLMGALEEKE